MGISFKDMFAHMGLIAWGVVITLLLMSIMSIGVMIERWYTYSQATKQSRKYAPEVARLLKQGKIKEAIDVSHGVGVKHSHLAKVLVVGLQEWQYQQESGEAERDKEGAVDAAKRAIQRATAVNLADLKRGLSGLATIGSTAPFVGLFGTTFGIINAFGGMAARAPAVSRPSRPASPRRSSPPPSVCSSPCRPCGPTTTWPAGSRASTSRWTTRAPSCSTTSSRRAPRPRARVRPPVAGGRARFQEVKEF